MTISIKEVIQGERTQRFVFAVLLLVMVLWYGEYRLAEVQNKSNSNLASTTNIISDDIKNLNDKITSIVEQNNLLNDTVQTEIIKNSDLADQLDQVNDTAAALDKLSKVDIQLLQKYSKVYFLNENYTPADLATIPDKYVFYENRDYEFYDKVEPFLENMLKKAQSDDIDIKIISAYRSFDEQSVLKSTYKVVYGVGTANQFSADQGYSEHQLGTAVDFTTSELKENYETFDNTPAYDWLVSNAHKYGFIMSYPKNNSYYIYEPWHWRFVGVDLAERLHRQNKNFYDLDQRTINNYLGVFFD